MFDFLQISEIICWILLGISLLLGVMGFILSLDKAIAPKRYAGKGKIVALEEKTFRHLTFIGNVPISSSSTSFKVTYVIKGEEHESKVDKKSFSNLRVGQLIDVYIYEGRFMSDYCLSNE